MYRAAGHSCELLAYICEGVGRRAGNANSLASDMLTKCFDICKVLGRPASCLQPMEAADRSASCMASDGAADKAANFSKRLLLVQQAGLADSFL